MSLRIGYDVTPLHAASGGVKTYTASLYEQLGRCSRDQIVPLTHLPFDQSTGLPAVTPKFRINKTFWMQAVLPLQLARLRPDLCHFTNSVAPLVAPCPTVLTIYDMTMWLHPHLHTTKRLLAMRSIIPLAARRAASIITVSESAKRDVVRILGLPQKKVKVVYGAASPIFRPLPRDVLKAVRQEYSLPPRFILHVGTIEPRKNLVRLLEAMALLQKHGADVPPLLLVGERGWKDGPFYTAIKRLNLDGLRICGFVPRDVLVAFYNLADLLVFPSLYEGFGLPIVEAMSCGTPVLSSRNGSLDEVAGDAADYLDATSVESIAAALERLSADPVRRAELREKGLLRARTFNWEVTANQTRQVYAEALAQARG